MFRIALKGVLARKGRLLLTSLAVILGTAFLAGSFVFTDTIQRTFDNLFADVYKNTDAVVRSSNKIEGDFGGQTLRANIPASLLDEVRSQPGVAQAEPDVSGMAIIIDANGDKIGGGGPPQFGSNFYEGELSPWKLTEGSSPPTADDEVVLDHGSFEEGDFSIGDTVRIAGVNGSSDFTIVGSAKFGEVDSPAGATFAMFDLAAAQEFLLPARSDGSTADELTSISVKSDGSISDAELADELQARLGSESDVLTGAEITKETQDDIKEGLQFFTIILTAFAGISLFVACFVIYNVFSITQAQRSKESALMRAIGSSRRQVTSTLLVEAVIVGIVGSLLGLLGGIGLAKAMTSLLAAAGVDIPSTGIALLTRTIVVTLIVGLLVTVLSAVVPARKAGRVPPVAAMRDSAIESTEFSFRRLVVGLVLLGLAIALIVMGLSGALLALVPGILLVFIALFVLGPLVARRFSLMLGKPIAAVKGVTGHLARENSARNPKRTASTAAALLVGVTLVSGVAVVAASMQSSIRDIFNKQIVGDVVVNSDSQDGMTGFSTSLADQVGELPGVEAAAGVSFNYVLMGDDKDDKKAVSVVNPVAAAKVFDFKVTDGSMDAVDASGMAISTDYAKDENLSIGDTVDVTLLNGSTHTLTVEAIYDEDILAGPRVVSRDLFADSGQPILDIWVYVVRDPGTSADAVKAEISQVVDEYGFGKVQTRKEYIDDQARQLTQVLNLVYGLLGLSVFIAAFGILLTMLLSVFERRHELALSRAVGMSRRQVRSMVRWEAVITSVLGAIQGVIVGSVLGFAVYWALRDQGFEKFAYPVGTVIVVTVLAAVIGVLAAIIPARRATKVNVVEAISTT